MKYALFCLGMVLIVVGGYFLYSGSNIIEVERGWSSVIAGTTALTGGIITLGLAGVVQSLEELKRDWAGAPARLDANAPDLATQAPAPAALAPATMASAIARKFGPAPEADEAAAAPVEAEAVVAAEESAARAPDFVPTPPAKEWLRPRPKFSPRPAAPAGTEPSPAIAELRRRVAQDLNLDWPSFNAPPVVASPDPLPAGPESTEAVTPPPLGLDDFADEHVEISRESGADLFAAPESREIPEETPPPPIAAAPEPEPEPEPVAADAAKPASKAIGRYEADGTVYVMFADGSIEAQSAQGIRRFKSMADLKASFQS